MDRPRPPGVAVAMALRSAGLFKVILRQLLVWFSCLDSEMQDFSERGEKIVERRLGKFVNE